jgi:hypothetical protein
MPRKPIRQSSSRSVIQKAQDRVTAKIDLHTVGRHTHYQAYFAA